MRKLRGKLSVPFGQTEESLRGFSSGDGAAKRRHAAARERQLIAFSRQHVPRRRLNTTSAEKAGAERFPAALKDKTAKANFFSSNSSKLPPHTTTIDTATMTNTMKTANQTSVASGPCPLNDHEAARTRYNAWSQQWWNNNFREGEHDDFIVAAVLAGFRREVKLNYGPESVDHIPVVPEEVRNIPVDRIGKRENAVVDNLEYKAATFGKVHVSDDDTDNTRLAKRVRRVNRDKSDNTKPKVQSESLLRRAELDSGDEDSSAPSARVSPAPATNPFRHGRQLVDGRRPKTRTYARRKSQASYTDNSDKEDKAENSDDGHHSAINDFAHNPRVRSPQHTRSGSVDSSISLDSNVTLEVGSSPGK